MLQDKRTRLYWLATLCLSVSCSGSSASPSTSTLSASSVARSVGGTMAGDLPAVGSFGACIGTVIGPRKVLTAAHCLTGHVPSDFSFLLGVDRNQPTYTLPVVGIQVHPLFDANLNNDVGLLTLGIDAPVPPAKLVQAIDATWVGRPLEFVGFGTDDGAQRTSAGIEGDVTAPVTDVLATVITFSSSGKNTCFGNNGGPSFYTDAAGNKLLVSITSYTSSADCSGTSGATRVDAFADFIGATTVIPSRSAAAIPATGCGAETTQGRCDGDTAIWCGTDIQVHSQDCNSVAEHCGFSFTSQSYGCAAAAAAPVTGACEGETFQGRCDGQTSVWCYDNLEVVHDDCTSVNKVCAYDFHVGYYDCVPPQPTAANCQGESFEGRCDGNVSIWCYNNSQVVRDDCASVNKVCAYNPQTGYNDCLDASTGP